MAVEIEPLFQKCLKFGFQNKTVENCLSLFLMTFRISKMKNGLDDINDKCRRYVELCFERAVENSVNEASSMPFEVLKYFLRSKSINISGERFLWSLIESWVQKNPSGRMPNVPELLTYLCLQEIDDELAAEIITSPIIRRNSLYNTLVDPNVDVFHVSDKRKAEIVLHYNNVPPINSGFRLPQSVYFVLKEELNSHGRYSREMFLSYDDNLDVWRKLGEISFRVFKILRIAHRLYIFHLELIIDGFYTTDGYVKGALIYDLLKNESKRMSQVSPTPIPCSSSFYVEALGHIYFLKSHYQRPILLQQYVEEKDIWISITIRTEVNRIVAAVGFEDQIYVIGRREEELMILEVYDPFSNLWMTLSRPHVRRSGKAEAVVYQKKIFLIGGRTDNEFYARVVEVYDPIRDEWMTWPDLPDVFRDTTSTVVKGRLYIYKKLYFYRQHLLGTYWDGSGEWKVINGQSSLRQLSICAIEGEDVVRGIMEKNKAVDISDWKETDGLEKEMLLKSKD